MEIELFEPKEIEHLPLHEQIIVLKNIAREVNTQDILQLENIDKIIEMKRVIEVMDIPVLMSEG